MILSQEEKYEIIEDIFTIYKNGFTFHQLYEKNAKFPQIMEHNSEAVKGFKKTILQKRPI